MADARHGELTMQAVVPGSARRRARSAWAGQALGADTETVLSELLGLRPEELAAAAADGVVGKEREGAAMTKTEISRPS